MTKNTVVIPTFARPEFLAVALKMLNYAKSLPIDILIFADYGINIEEVQYVFNKFAPPAAKLIFRPEHRPVSSGCFNILESLRDGYNTGADIVYLIEEDVFIRPEFFEKHQEIIFTDGYSVSCGRKCSRFWRTHPNIYTNPGSALSRRFLDKLIPHINDKFYDNTGEYIKNLRPDKPGFIGGLDDGLIRRIIDIEGFSVYHQDPPVCSHVGFQAYENRYDFCKIDSDASIDKRVEQLKQMFIRLEPIHGPHKMHLRDLDPLSNEQLQILSLS